MGFWDTLFGGKGDDKDDDERRPTQERRGELRDGKRFGRWIEQDTTLMFDRTYVDGQLHGPSRAWHPDGHPHEKAMFVAGKRDGVTYRYHAGGILAVEVHYAGGKMNGRARGWDATGTLLYDREYRDDELWDGLYERTGVERGHYKDGKKDGLWEAWMWDRKTIKERGTYVGGKRHGAFELRENEWESWHGTFEMDERVGEWELRKKSGLVARGAYPAGTPTRWTATLGESSDTSEVSTPKELETWAYAVDKALQKKTERAAAARTRLRRKPDPWTPEDHARAREQMKASPPVAPLTEIDEAPPFEAAGRDVLVHAIGDIAGLAHPEVSVKEDSDDWYPPARGVLVVVATIDLPDHMIVDSPEHPDLARTYPFRPGTYELVGLDSGERLWLPLVIARLPGAAITCWRYLGEAHDSNYGLYAATLALDGFDWPDHPGDHVRGPAEWIRPEVGPSVWITNPSGNGIRAYAGIDDAGDIVAIFLLGD